MIVVVVQFVSSKVSCRSEMLDSCWIEYCMYEIVVWKLMVCWSI